MFRKLALPLAVAAAAVAASSAAAAPRSETLQLVSVQKSFTISPGGPPAVGSRMIFTQAIYNRVRQFGEPAGARVGRVEVVCTIVSSTDAQCFVTAHVPTGQIVAAGAMRTTQGPATIRFAILGGAGAFGGVRGTVLSKDVSQTKSLVTLRLQP